MSWMNDSLSSALDRQRHEDAGSPTRREFSCPTCGNRWVVETRTSGDVESPDGMGRRSHLDRRVVEGQPCECGLRALRLAEKARERRREEREEVQYSLPFGSEYFTSSLDHKEGWATYRATGAVWFDEPGHDCRRQDGAGKTFLIHPQVGVYRMEGGQIVRLVNLFVYPPHHQSIVTAINRDEKVVTRRLGRNGEVLEEFEGVRVDLFGLEEVKA